MKRQLIVPVISMAVLFGCAAAVVSGPQNVNYPANKGVLYGTVDRADNKQVRELYAPGAVIEAVKAGKPVPPGILTMVLYKAQVDAKGDPVKGANGRFQKGDQIAHFVMEKRAGWGADYGPEKRNGEWEYRAFTPDGQANDKTDVGPCFTCHLKVTSTDYLFSTAMMKAAK